MVHRCLYVIMSIIGTIHRLFLENVTFAKCGKGQMRMQMLIDFIELMEGIFRSNAI